MTVWSVLDPFIKIIVEEIWFQIVVDQLKLVVPVVGWLATLRHSYHLSPKTWYLKDRHFG